MVQLLHMFDNLQPGRYVVAVSGGVDSVVLLDLLRQNPEYQLVVAHYDHGMREDSATDRKFVGKIAKQHGLPFVYDEGNLGASASEANAREARYNFLYKVRLQTNADGIVTAHHQDDLLETALLNLLRGTHRKGLTSLKSTDIIKRPLLHMPKQHIMKYARANGLVWREDVTNLDTKYKRNYVRHRLITKLTPTQRQHLLAHVRRMHKINQELDVELANLLHLQPSKTELDRRYLISLPYDVASELIAVWLAKNGIRNYDKGTINRIVVHAKTLRPGQYITVNQCHFILVQKQTLALKSRDR